MKSISLAPGSKERIMAAKSVVMTEIIVLTGKDKVSASKLEYVRQGHC